MALSLHVRGTKGLGASGPKRARTHIPFYSSIPSLRVSIRHHVAPVSAAPHLIMNQCRTQRFLQAAYCLWFRQGRWTIPGGRMAVGLGARGCSAAAVLPPSWCEVSRPYSPLLCAKTLRSLRRNLALRFWNQTCNRSC